MTGICSCCARAASGQKAVTPPTTLMNFRRCMLLSLVQHFIARQVSVATKGRLSKGKHRSLPSTERCQSRTSANDGSVVDRLKRTSFDHLVGSGKQRWTNLETQTHGGFHVDHELELAGNLNRQI